MSCFKLPVHIYKEICKISTKFWWGSSKNSGKKISWVAWDKLALPKSDGGLGFQDLGLFNEALLTKQLWRLVSQPNLLISKVLKAKYFSKGGLLGCVPRSGDSWVWKSWLKSKKALEMGLRLQVGSGNVVRIWEAPWLLKTPAFMISGIKPADCEIVWARELMTDNGKNWNIGILEQLFCVEDIKNILQVPIKQDGSSDKWIWHWDSKGQFSVKSAYDQLLQARKNEKD
ncbi:hypothetical protein DH2020_035122 [Rehmannia glutinosa]|uniref:Uncharacterized protein n=1 Tax=Rehmannia glutinosa TaxID=99300 RepID=A0ABR0V7C3_REHGL